MKVLIENSVGSRSTSMKHARNYVKRNRAMWVKQAQTPTIRFIESDHRHISAAKCVIRPPREQGRFYEAGADTMAEQYQVQGVGMVGDAAKLFEIGVLGAWAWTAAVDRMPQQNVNNNAHPSLRTAIVRARYAR